MEVGDLGEGRILAEVCSDRGLQKQEERAEGADGKLCTDRTLYGKIQALHPVLDHQFSF